MKRSPYFSGSTILELVIAMGVFSLVIMSTMSLLMSSRTLVTDAPQAHAATLAAQEGLEAARLLRDQAWSNLTDGVHGLAKNNGSWEFSGASDASQGFTRTVTVASNGAYGKVVTSKVAWQAQGGRNLSVTLHTLLTNWTQAEQNNQVSGDWANPFSAGSGDVDTGVAGTDVLVQNGKAFVSSSASNAAKPDLSIFDVADPNNPVKISSKDLGVSNISSITKVGNYVFASIANSSNEFMVIDVSNLANPTVIKSVDFSNGKSRTLTVSGTTLYIGMEQITGESEFFAVDVSDPVNPTVIGNFEVNANVSSIYIFNNQAYITTWKDDAELVILDISDPTHITKLGQYNATGPENGTSVFVKDEANVYIGRQESDTGEEFIALNCSNPASCIRRGGMELLAGVNDMVVINYLAFLVTEQPNAEFRILNIADPTNIFSYSYLNFPEAATGIAFENNTVYTSVRSNDALRIIKSSP